MRIVGLVLLFAVLIMAGFLIEALLVMWFTWALHDVGYVSHALNFNQSCVLALPLFIASSAGALFSSR
jgi:hypothetical protein